MKKLLFILITGLQFMSVQAQEGKTGFFRWAFVRVDEKSQVSQVEKSEIPAANSGDRMEFYFRPMKNAYLYLLLCGPDNSVQLLFPASFGDFNSYYETFEQTIPAVEIPGQPGKYELHVIVTSSRHEKLEELLNRYNKFDVIDDIDPHGKMDGEEKNELGNQILSLVKKIKRSFYFDTEKQVLFTDKAAPVRTGEEKIAEFINKIEFKDLYVKLYTIKKE